MNTILETTLSHILKIKTFKNNIKLVWEYSSSRYHVPSSSFRIWVFGYRDNLPLELASELQTNGYHLLWFVFLISRVV